MKPEIWWVDDDFLDVDSDNSKLFRKLSESDVLRMRKFSPREFEDFLGSPSNTAPSLFLVDYKLNEKPDPADEGRRYPFTGTGIFGLIRDKYPEHPIYLISKLFSGVPSCDDQESELFDRIVFYDWLTERGQKTAKLVLTCDSRDYSALRRVRARDAEAPILRLIGVPKADEKDFEKVMPGRFRGGIGKNSEYPVQPEHSKLTELAKWIRYDFLRLPGLLVGDVEAATVLGMTKQYFEKKFIPKLGAKVQSRLIYCGVFSSTIFEKSGDKLVPSRRWWKSSIIDYIYSQPGFENHTFSTKPWEDAHIIFSLDGKSKSRCAVCKKLYPETVGIDASDRSIVEPVHLRCSYIDDTVKRNPIYEPVRYLRD